MTKKELFEAAIEIVTNSDYEDKDEIVEFFIKEIDKIEARAEKAAERAAKRKAEGDALRETVKEALTDEYQTIDEIVAKIDDEEVTKAKVTARLTQLCSLGEAEKDTEKVESRKLTVYRLAN